MKARLATLKAKKVNKRVKREAETDGTDSSRPSKRIKREEILVPRPGEMIDLNFGKLTLNVSMSWYSLQ